MLTGALLWLASNAAEIKIRVRHPLLKSSCAAPFPVLAASGRNPAKSASANGWKNIAPGSTSRQQLPPGHPRRTGVWIGRVPLLHRDSCPQIEIVFACPHNAQPRTGFLAVLLGTTILL